MALKSMTGFARADGALDDVHWHWEFRSVNGRGLDIRMRVPSGYEALEQPVREACAKRLSRGNCSIGLSVKRQAGHAQVRLNEDALEQVIKAVEKAKELTGASAPSIDGLLSLKGVLEVSEPEESEEQAKARQDAMLTSFIAALENMDTARREEGARLSDAIAAQLNQIEANVAAIEAAPARSTDAIGQKLAAQVKRLLDADDRLDADRLHQEAVLLAAKADIEEEIERLKAHVGAGRELLRSNEPVGRRFDFLAQEFNREANTICSKSNDTQITKLGLEVKTLVDQMREQVQNIE